MADAEIEVIKTTRVTLAMDEEEAGYLLDALSAHLAGSLVNSNNPLGKVRMALEEAKVQRIRAWRIKGLGDYAALYATKEDVPVSRQYEAAQMP